MILVDANLLVYAAGPSMAQHKPALAWLDARLNGTARVGLPWPSLLAVVRIGSNPRAFDPPLTTATAWQLVRRWLDHPLTWIPAAGERHAEILGRLIGDGIPSRLVPDAHLAALAIEHGLSVCSADADFARFPEARWQNPLA